MFPQSYGSIFAQLGKLNKSERKFNFSQSTVNLANHNKVFK